MTPETEKPVWISEADVVAMMDIGGAIDALEQGLMAEARNEAQNMIKTHVEWDGGSTLHAIGAVFPTAGFCGTKVWSHTKNGATPMLLLFDSNDGSLKAIIEAFALGQMRTAAACGVATQWLAEPTAEEFAIIGTGKQAISQVAAVLAVRPIRRIRVFSPDEGHRSRFVERLRSEFELDTVAASSVREAVEGASIITLATRAKDPILSADMVERGAHINSVGAIVPSRAEVTSDVLSRSGRIVTDSVPQARKLSRELIDFLGSDDARWKRVQPLSMIVSERFPRSEADDLTLFKSLGVGISDLSLGIQLYRDAVSSQRGYKFSPPQRVQPRLRRSQAVQTFNRR
jgi:ornithine cyclodeaminase